MMGRIKVFNCYLLLRCVAGSGSNFFCLTRSSSVLGADAMWQMVEVEVELVELALYLSITAQPKTVLVAMGPG